MSHSLTPAPQYLRQSREVCAADPLVYNELAVVMYRTGRFKEAVELLGLVVNLTRSSAQHLRPMWEPVWFNLGHAQRKLGYGAVAMCECGGHLLLHPSQYSTVHSNYKKALAAYEECLALDAQRASTYAAIGFTQLLLGRLDEAIDNLHKVTCSSHS